MLQPRVYIATAYFYVPIIGDDMYAYLRWHSTPTKIGDVFSLEFSSSWNYMNLPAKKISFVVLTIPPISQNVFTAKFIALCLENTKVYVLSALIPLIASDKLVFDIYML